MHSASLMREVTLRDLEQLIEEAGYPHRLVLSKEVFFHLQSHVAPMNRFVDKLDHAGHAEFRWHYTPYRQPHITVQLICWVPTVPNRPEEVDKSTWPLLIETPNGL